VRRRDTREGEEKGTWSAGIRGGLCLRIVSVQEDYVGVRY